MAVDCSGSTKPRFASEGKFTRLFCRASRRYAINANQNEIITIKDLYRGLKDDELAEAESNLTNYLNVVGRLLERMHREGTSGKKFGTLSCTTPDSGRSNKSPPK